MVILRKPVARLTAAALERFLTRARRAVKLRGTVNVLVATSGELRMLNRRFRGLDKPTDVLSFAPLPDQDSKFAGDLAVSADMAARNARLLGHPPAAEVKLLVLHGLLHLAGYDHESDSGEMARREERLRQQLGLPSALIGRGQGASRRPGREPHRPQAARAATAARRRLR
ncbi:MAG TPA: rRNA maturation RNase YbeY [Terriglobales bacterium]|nr:rRNA maturation RNase YbeY [Terriglobales bacterium]